MTRASSFALLILFTASCGRIDHIGRPPSFSEPDTSMERVAMRAAGPGEPVLPMRVSETASLWSGEQGSLLGDRRAMKQGDILTVVIEIDESAKISNSSERARSGSESLGVPQLFGVPQRIDQTISEGASMADAVSIDSASKAKGNGSVRRSEQLTLRVAATVTGVLPNGVLQIEGMQEVRVNFELRELLVSGYVRPEDISRQNEITYDKIASARISYGGRGQITDVQQPRIGQQVLDAVLPF
ncbi:flagellar basal body L-ring protein FlgH [Thalassococcus sp. CAU 1522]|uniref:Flagellar L-ring protein n=1 Tax=Thalassococcus arenae TaxID=2851652 RepID=A0ABS6N6C3_9RHOB|nr:flagellar basal body L-ring protein FlgH [Thalassococcus arenae]MBV2359338.1 flagellar basal body L-ring protein FlgH [Thalassococcus arenae]